MVSPATKSEVGRPNRNCVRACEKGRGITSAGCLRHLYAQKVELYTCRQIHTKNLESVRSCPRQACYNRRPPGTDWCEYTARANTRHGPGPTYFKVRRAASSKTGKSNACLCTTRVGEWARGLWANSDSNGLVWLDLSLTLA